MYVLSIGKCCFIRKANRHTNGRGEHKHAYPLGVLEVCNLDFSGQNRKNYYEEHNRSNVYVIEGNCPSEKMVAITERYKTMKWWHRTWHKELKLDCHQWIQRRPQEKYDSSNGDDN